MCLGHQTLCEFFGGELYNLDKVRHGRIQRLKVRSNSPLFEGLPLEFQIGLYHSWAIREQSFPDSLTITAHCAEEVVMAFQHKSLPIYGVQFHPESFMTEYGEQLLRNWLES
ncbi:putative anthranilate synthase component II [Pasteurella canis]|nr:putative anthranilate synthase component II [Pasteurella canis]